MINLEYYRAFYYVAVYQSISRAAEEMYISQPAVSKSIRNLEEALKCTLFVRSTRGTTLTHDGMLLFEHVSLAFREFEAGEDKVCRSDSKLTQELFIGATESPLYSIVLPKLLVFKKSFPGVRIHISGFSSGKLLDMLEEGTIDLALGVTPITRHTSFPITELGELRDVFFAHRDFPIDDSIALTPQALATYPIVGVGTGSNAGKHISSFFSANGITYEPMFTVETSSQVLPFVEAQLAIGVAPRWALEMHNRTGVLRILNTSVSIPTRRIFLAVNEKYPVTPVCHKFIELIKS